MCTALQVAFVAEQPLEHTVDVTARSKYLLEGGRWVECPLA